MEGARITRLLCEISILKYCLLNELFEKWRIPPPPSPLVMWPVVGRHMISSGSFWRVPTWDPPPLARHSGGGGAWVALSRALVGVAGSWYRRGERFTVLGSSWVAPFFLSRAGQPCILVCLLSVQEISCKSMHFTGEWFGFFVHK
jgi:hypothetical protein